MNLNYSYRAFLLSCLLLGNLVLLLTSSTLSNNIEQDDEVFAVEYAAIIDDELEEDIAMRMVPAPEIETHSAYNEAQEFIEAQENSRNGDAPTEEPDVARTENSREDSSKDSTIKEAQEKLNELKKELSQHVTPTASSEGSNKKTTISYYLVQRKARKLPNPVYTCASGGKIVIDIQVSPHGNVKKASYNEEASTTTNGCLIDSALLYARKARFATNTSNKDQKGTITYSFPGQY